MELSAFGLQSPNFVFAAVTLVGLLISGGIGVYLLADGLRLRNENPTQSETLMWDSLPFILIAISFLVVGALSILGLVALLGILGQNSTQKNR